MWLTELWHTIHAVQWVDMLDIAVIACLLYMVLLWFKRARAAFVARGMLIFMLLYVVAQQVGMYLTTRLFHALLAVALIALVVIFQEELRSFFERLALWSVRRRRRKSQMTPKVVEVLVRMAGQFARDRIGALFVLTGADPLERHIEGGEALNGEPSELLIESLFDTHSGGHDGAVIIEHGRIAQFGAHLPLSKEFGKLGRKGTRHAAALGLSERTDALCLVVSEERGTISIALHGDLTHANNLEDLERQLTAFVHAKTPAPRTVRWGDALQHHFGEKAVALGMACVLWLIFAQGFAWSTAQFQVPVEVLTPPDVRVAVLRPAQVGVSVKGLQRTLDLLNPLNLRATVDLLEADPGVYHVRLSRDHLTLPGAVHVDTVDPPMVDIELTKITRPFLGLFRGEEPETSAQDETMEIP